MWGNGEPGAKLDFSDKPPEGFVRGGDDDEATPSGPSAMDVEEDSSSDEEEEQEGGRADAGAKASKSGACAHNNTASRLPSLSTSCASCESCHFPLMIAPP